MGQGLAGATFGDGKGVPLVLVHGFPLDGRMWERQAGALAAKVRVLVPDLRGFGRSPLPRGPHSIEDHARDLAACMDAHGAPKGVICGFSMGGYVALAFAALFPWRVAGLVLADTRAAADSASAKEVRSATARRVLAEGMTFLADDMLFKLLSERTLREGVDLSRRVWSMMVDQRREGVAAALLAMRDRPSRLDLLRRITCPTLVAVGSQDAVTPPIEAEGLAGLIPGASYVEIPGAGHLACMEEPERFNGAVLDLLARVQEQRP
ncbi:MAG: alpha/beta fold hydrolase [Acidobacteriota bacterium]